MQTPIIFIHYGDTPYLKYTLDIAQKMNPEKEVFLLGDEKNKKYARKLNIKYIPFTKFEGSQSVGDLNKNFKYIAGINRQTEQDKRFELFCFKRWFYLYEFMKENNLNSCWYFDSDTLILSNLNKKEESKFSQYEITEQSNGSNMKGLIKFSPLEKFIRTTNELFLDKKYLTEQKKDMREYPNYAFCDMRAYRAFKEKNNPAVIKLNTEINKETHDENICQDDGMETEYIDSLKRIIKKLYFKNNNIYEKNKTTKELIKIKTLNMSWVTTSFIEKVYYYKRYGKFPPFYISLLGKISRIPRFIKTRITKTVK